MNVILDEQQCDILKKASQINKREQRFLFDLEKEIKQCLDSLRGDYSAFNKAQKIFKIKSWYMDFQGTIRDVYIKDKDLRKQYGVRKIIQFYNGTDTICIENKLKDYAIFLNFVHSIINFIKEKSLTLENNLDSRKEYLAAIKSLNCMET